MKISITDVRRKTKNILKALESGKVIQIFYRGKLRGKIIPNDSMKKRKTKEHPFFGMAVRDKFSVKQSMQYLRGGRY